MRHNDAFIASLCPSFELALDSYSFQFLWLIPVTEIMWADGRCQREEAEMLFHYVDRSVNLVSVDVPEIPPTVPGASFSRSSMPRWAVMNTSGPN